MVSSVSVKLQTPKSSKRTILAALADIMEFMIDELPNGGFYIYFIWGGGLDVRGFVPVWGCLKRSASFA